MENLSRRRQLSGPNPPFFTVLEDPNTIKSSTVVGDAAYREHAYQACERKIMSVKKELGGYGFELENMSDAIVNVGPTMVSRSKLAKIGDKYVNRIVEPYPLFPEPDILLKQAPNASPLYVVEPSNIWFKDLVSHVNDLPPDQAKRVVLIHEKADHLRWFDPEGRLQGIPDGKAGLIYSNYTYTYELMQEGNLFWDCLGEANRILAKGGVLVASNDDSVSKKHHRETMRQLGFGFLGGGKTMTYLIKR